MTDEPRWSGFLWRDGDGIRGTMVDAFGMVTLITGVPTIVSGVRGYAIEARLIEVPLDLQLPGDDFAARPRVA